MAWRAWVARLALRVAEKRLGDVERGGLVEVRDPPFAGRREMEVEATAWLASLLARLSRATGDAGLLRAARRAADAVAAEADAEGKWLLWSYTAITASQLLAYALRARDSGLAAGLARTVRGLARVVHVPNQEAFSAHALAAHASLTGDGASAAAAARKARSLLTLASAWRWSMDEPWGATTAYHAAALWALTDPPGLAEPPAEAYAVVEGLVDPHARAFAPIGRSAYFSFAHATAAAVLARRAWRAGDPRASRAASDALDDFRRLFAGDGGVRKNPHGSTVIREYGPRELYETWSAAVLAGMLEEPEPPPPAPPPRGPVEAWHPRSYTAVYAPRSAAVVAAGGYRGFDNHQPPCSIAYARTPAGTAAYTPLTGSQWSWAAAPLALLEAGELRPVHPAAYAARAGRGWCVLAGLLPDGTLWTRAAALTPRGVSVKDSTLPPRRAATLLALREGAARRLGDALALPGGGAARGPGGVELLGSAPAQPGRVEVYAFPWRGSGTITVLLDPDAPAGPAGGPAAAGLPAAARAWLERLRDRLLYAAYARGLL